MKGFEPQVEPFIQMEAEDEDVLVRALAQYSDVQLLLELRRRKVLGRVDYHTIIPGYAVASGYPLDGQILDTYRGLAEKLNRAHQVDRQPPGCKVETGGFIPGSFSQHEHPDRKVTLVLNYVVDLKR
jgi:hypothetical protein